MNQTGVGASTLEGAAMPREIPTLEAFFLETPLYTRFEINRWNFKRVERIEFFKGALDAFCIECEKDSVFSFRPSKLQGVLTGSVPSPPVITGMGAPKAKEEIRSNSQEDLEAWQKKYAVGPRIRLVEFRCTRDDDHALFFFFQIRDAKIMKIGQYPSLADLQSGKIKKYRKILGDDKYKELIRAVGLSAPGVGIAAFVYLRRIFEGLIDDARTEAAKEEGWDDEEFQRSHVDEKILMLRDFLPSFLIENRTIYSILSKGIHSLTEEECLSYFEPLKLGIELILDEKIEQEERTKKISKTRKALDSIRSELG
jgi:hypothetical protein